MQRQKALQLFRTQCGTQCTLCLTCDRPVFPDEYDRNWSEFCHHHMRPKIDEPELDNLKEKRRRVCQAVLREPQTCSDVRPEVCAPPAGWMSEGPTSPSSPSEQDRHVHSECEPASVAREETVDAFLFQRPQLLRMKRYVFVRKRDHRKLGEEWLGLPTDQRSRWEEEAAKRKAIYDSEYDRYRRKGGAEPKRPLSDYFLWVSFLRQTGRIGLTGTM